MKPEDLVAIAHAAGMAVEQHATNPPRPVGVIKLDADRKFSYGIPIKDFEAIVTHAVARFLETSSQYVTNDATRESALAAERERCARLADELLLGVLGNGKTSTPIYRRNVGAAILELK